MKKLINWKLFGILLGVCVFGDIANQAELLLKRPPVPLFMLSTIFLNAVMSAVFIFVGLYLAKKVGLGVPVLESWLEGKETRTYLKSILGISIASGVIVGFLIILLDLLFDVPIESVIVSQVTIPLISVSPIRWQYVLAAFYRGIAGEVMMRLFLMTLLVWVFYKIKKTEKGKPTNFGIWLAIIISAVLLYIVHLPFTATLIQITTLIVIRIIILNGIDGIVFGWLYWKKGLESAMISNFSAAIVRSVILPL